ncbi:hypothetical protein EC991_000489 [Linnemannia zychae]|nr:hypothetical protein EC991_000489 [Linnemannia zychae]
MTDNHNGDTGQYLQPPFQKLPNECFYIIVDHLWDDLPTLHTLLLVNRFFFRAAIPKIMDKPLETWEMTMYEPKYPTSSEKLIALVLASLLHYQQRITGKDPSSILAEYGLQLVPSTGLELLKPFLPVVKNDDGVEVQREQNHRSPITLDYSKFFTILNSYHWKYVEYRHFIRLIEMPESLRNSQGTHPVLDEIADQPAVNTTTDDSTVATRQDEHTEDIQERCEYKDLVREAFAQLLLHYNIEIITEFSFHISEARKCLPLASKMAKLQHLLLYRDDSVFDQHIQDSINFIHLNKESFPGKPCLQLGFDYRWSDVDISVFTSIRESRRNISNAMKFKLDLYKAVGQPEDLDIGYIPGFYGLADDISTERLLRLDDVDSFRIDMDEGRDMEAFLKRCRRLEAIMMHIGHPYIFSWAAQHARYHADGKRSASGRALLTDLLPRLYDLYLYSDRPYRFSIHALNDCMVAFSKSLGTVSVINNHEFRTRGGQTTDPWILQKDNEKSRMIHTSPLANRVGDWPYPLPSLRSLRIDLRCTSFIYVGSLDQCFNLEELDLRYGAVGGAPRALGSSNDDPNADPLRQAPFDTNLFPRWNLPRLKTLYLSGTPALLFDYDSLEGMPNLEEMTLSCRKKVDLEERLQDIPRLSLHTSRICPDLASSQETASTDDSAASTSAASTSSKGTIWTRNWTLPKLKTLEMEGPPATVFTFDWLKGCPSLTSVTLSLHLYGSLQRLPLIALSPDTYLLPPPTEKSILESTQNKTQGVAADADPNTGAEVFMDSKLESLHLKGPWVITAPDLTTLMTDNAPFLKSFTLDKVQRRGGMSAGAFVQAFRVADEICRKRYGEDWDARPGDVADYDYDDDDDEGAVEEVLTEHQSELKNGTGAGSGLPVDSQTSSGVAHLDVIPERPLPGRSLLTVETDYTFSKRMRDPANLVGICTDEADEYRRCGIRVYGFSRCYSVDKYDKAWYNRNKGTEWWEAYFK